MCVHVNIGAMAAGGGFRSPGPEVMGGWALPDWELNSYPLQDPYVLSTTEPSPALRKDQEFKTALSYTMSLWLAWAT